MPTLRPQIPVFAGESGDTLRFIRQMGIEYVSLGMRRDQIDYGFLESEEARLMEHGLKVSDAWCPDFQKNKSIHLGLADRDKETDAFIHMLDVYGRCGFPFTSIAWQPNGILRTSRSVGKRSWGGETFICDQDEILSRPYAEGRLYSEEEIWDNFALFIEKVIPVAEETGVKLALHPNDPPLGCMAGIPSLIYDSDCYRKAFKLAGSRMLGMKLCVGCWLEAGEAFGDLMGDIREFNEDGRILCVHFRNVSSKLPYFEETLAEDGYADMYAIMKELVAVGCDAVISIDHGFKPIEGFGGLAGSFAYSTGYMKAMMHIAEREVGL